MTDMPKQPNPVDVHVGSRIRLRRRIMGLSQEALADVLELTFQQVQKYECGANRVSASKLFGIAQVLQVPANYFFDGLPAPPGGADSESVSLAEIEGAIRAFLATAEGLELARRFPRIQNGRLRQQVLGLVRALTDETEAAPAAVND